MIHLEKVCKSFAAFHAVKDISVTIPDGEIFGLVGPNGAGKTTTLRMMTGLLTPDRGRIYLAGHDIVQESLRAKSILGYIPDRAFLYEKLTARELLIFIAAIYGLEGKAAGTRIEELLVLLGIRDVADSLIESFSQGMRQRLLFAAALVHEPSVLLIDEPFSGLDPFGVRTLKEIIVSLAARGVSVFLTTHSLHIAEELCHRIGFINKGELIAVRQRDEIRESEGGLEGMFLKISG